MMIYVGVEMFLILMKVQSLMVISENKMLRRISGTRRHVTGEQVKLHNEELHNLDSLIQPFLK